MPIEPKPSADKIANVIEATVSAALITAVTLLGVIGFAAAVAVLAS